MLGDLLKTKMSNEQNAVEGERARVAALLKLKDGLDPALHTQVDQFVLDGKTVDEAKVALFDAVRTAAPAQPAQPDTTTAEPGPLPTVSHPETQQTHQTGEVSKDQVQQYMKAHGCGLKDAVLALSVKGGA